MKEIQMPARLRKFRRRLVQLGLVVVVLFIGVLTIVGCFQEKLMFPGAASQGRSSNVVRPSAAVEVVHLTSRDGTAIGGIFLKADGRAADRAPTVLFFYGNAMCAADCFDITTLIRSLGCNVLVCDYPGYGMSGGKPTEAGFYAMADAAYDHLLTRDDIDKTKIVSMGWSIGCGTAIDLASRRPVAALIAMSPFTSMTAIAKHTLPLPGVGLIVRHKFDNLSKIGMVDAPVFIAHGVNDTIIPCEMSRELAAKTSRPATTLYVEACGHNDVFEVDRETLVKSLGAFLFPSP